MGCLEHDITRNACQLFGAQARLGYDWWWHSFTARDAETGEEKPFFLEFFLCNPTLGGEQPIFGQLPENKAKGIKPSYLMVKAGCWGEGARQLHRFFGWKSVRVDYGVPFSVEADDCFLTETETRGHVSVTEAEAQAHPEWMSQSGEISWNLRIHKTIPFNVGYGASGPMRRWQLFEMFWHAEGMKTEYDGEISLNGRRYLVDRDTCFGYADKNWGKSFTSPWVWLSSCNLVSELTGRRLSGSVFDIGGGRPKVGFLALPRKLLSAFCYEGRGFEFNFSKFWTACRTRFRCEETSTHIVWHVEQRTWLNRMVTDIVCEKRDMLFVNYEAPNGEKRFQRLWNGGNGHGTVCLYHRGRLVDRIHAENVGCEYGEYEKL